MTTRADAPKRISRVSFAFALGFVPIAGLVAGSASLAPPAAAQSGTLVVTGDEEDGLKPEGTCSISYRHRNDFELVDWDQTVAKRIGRGRVGRSIFLTRDPIQEGHRPSVYYDRIDGRSNLEFTICLTNEGPEGVPWVDADWVGGNSTRFMLPKEGGYLLLGYEGQEFGGEHLLVEARASRSRSPRSATYTLHFSTDLSSDASETAESDDVGDVAMAMGEDPAMTSDPGPSFPSAEPEAQEDSGIISDEPWTADDDAQQATRSFPGLPTMPDIPTGPILDDLMPLIDPQDTSQFIPEGEVETVSDGFLEAPRWVEAGLDFRVSWEDRLSRQDRVTIVPEGTPDDILGEGQQNQRIGNNDSRSLRAPDQLGTYEVRYFSNDAETVHARVTVEVRDPYIELTVDDEVQAGRDFDVSWERRLSRSDRILIVPHDAPEDELGEGRQNQRIGNRDSRTLRAPNALGIHEVRYWRNTQERVVGSVLVDVVDPEIELDVPDIAHAGKDFAVSFSERLSRSDRILIVPHDAPDDARGEGRQDRRIGNRDSRTLRAPNSLGTYEVRYWRDEQERVVGREIIDVIDPEIIVMAPLEVEADTDFDVMLNERLSRSDRITIVPADSPEDTLGSGRQNRRIGNRTSRTLRAPELAGEFEVRYWRNEQERVAGRALVTVVPEGAAVTASDQDAGSAQDLIALMERLVDLASRLDEVPPEERRAVRNELIAFGPSGLAMLHEFVDTGRIEPWQAAGFVGGSFDPPPPAAVRPNAGFVPPAGHIPPVPAQDQPVATDQQAAQAQPAEQPPVAGDPGDSALQATGELSAQDERRVIMLIARLEGASSDAQQAIIDELAGYGPAAIDILLEMMLEGLIDRSLALRAAAAIEADGGAPAEEAQMPEAPAQQPAPQQAAQETSGYQVTGVAPDDMLNVRDRPGISGSTVIGRLAPDARDVVRTGAVQDVGGRDWWHVRHPSLPVDGGWVNSRFLTAEVGLAPDELAYRVTDVAADDALNIRSFPGADGDILARIPRDAGGLRWTGESAAVGNATWWELAHPDLPGGTGWVNSRFLEAQEGVAVASVDDPALSGLRPPFTEAEGYDRVDHGAALNRLFDTLPQTSSIFPPGGAFNPLTKSILLLENEEGVVPHARYRIRYGMANRADGTSGRSLPYSFVAIDRFNLGAVFREAIAESFGEARTPPAESFGAGEHVSYRMEFRPIQGRSADPVAMSRRVIADDESQALRCLARPCLDVAGVGEDAAPWHDHANSGTAFDRPYEDIRNGVYTPAAMADLLVLETGGGRVSDGRLIWTGYEESESVRPGEPFMEIVMDVNLAQDFGIEAVSRLGHLMDDSVAAIWKRAMTFPGGDDSPQLSMSRAFECARGEPNQEGLCP